MNSQQHGIYILLTPGFDDVFVTALVSNLRRQTIPTKLIALSTDPVRSSHGVCLNPDITVSDIKAHQWRSLLIIADSPAVSADQMTDPRIAHLVHRLSACGGETIAFTATATALFVLEPVLAAAPTDGVHVWKGGNIDQLARFAAQRFENIGHALNASLV